MWKANARPFKKRLLSQVLKVWVVAQSDECQSAAIMLASYQWTQQLFLCCNFVICVTQDHLFSCFDLFSLSFDLIKVSLQSHVCVKNASHQNTSKQSSP